MTLAERQASTAQEGSTDVPTLYHSIHGYTGPAKNSDFLYSAIRYTF